MQAAIDELADTIRSAAARRRPLRIRGGGTKDFYGGALEGAILDTRICRGIVDYDPTELVLTACCGTPLSEIESVMRSSGQMLAFEPPYFGEHATLGGCIACGLSGPRRPFAGAVRDFVLGVRLLDGTGTDMKFGGQVMKNVAGYDVSRLQVGALGTLGVLLEASIKTLPLPQSEVTLRMELPETQAIRSMNAWAGKPLTITATAHLEGELFVRLTGAAAAVAATQAQLGGEPLPEADRFWADVREQRLPFFTNAATLWRLSVKPTAPPLQVAGAQLIEWNGGLRWLATDADASAVRAAAAGAGGHATLFRARAKGPDPFQPLAPALHALHKRLKGTFDPHGILNLGRLYPDL
ncbi:MAG: glycolate oxidase subunit GlcE [Burkholderiales bacterium]